MKQQLTIELKLNWRDFISYPVAQFSLPWNRLASCGSHKVRIELLFRSIKSRKGKKAVFAFSIIILTLFERPIREKLPLCQFKSKCHWSKEER